MALLSTLYLVGILHCFCNITCLFHTKTLLADKVQSEDDRQKGAILTFKNGNGLEL